MKESCITCKYCMKLYVAPVEIFKHIPKDSYVCNMFNKTENVNRVDYIDNGRGMCEMYSPTLIVYESENGYTGKLYGESSMSIFDADGNEVMHTGSRTPNTLEELKEVVDGYPAFIEMLKKIPLDDLKDAEDDDI